MKRTLIYLSLLLVGIGIGYLLNFDWSPKETVHQVPEKIYIEKVKKEIIRDTIEIEKIVNVPIVKDTTIETDTLKTTDSLTMGKIEEIEIVNNNSIENEEIIIMEELIAQRTIPLQFPVNDSTDVEEMLNFKTSAFSDEIIVEFWQSPLNITGYELTRNKLKLFGFNPSESISLHLDKSEEQLTLDTESMDILLQKSKQFKTLKLK